MVVISEVSIRSDELLSNLLAIWESSVRASHDFLSEQEILEIKKFVPAAIRGVQHLVVAADEGELLGFMGVDGSKLEMMFLSPEHFAKGIGRKLMQFAFDNYAVNTLDVNEANPAARGFYEHVGFEVVSRSEQDSQGNPYPILSMRLVK